MTQKILLIQTASLGDVILSTSLAETLHKQFPEASIDYLVKKSYETLFAEHPFINQVVIWDKSGHKYRNLLKVISTVRAKKYDIVINVQRFASSGLISALSGAPYRSGFSKNPISFTFTKRVRHDITGTTHEIYRNIELIKPLINIPAERPRLYPTSDDFAFTNQWKNWPYITISPASLYFTKQFPSEKWIELIEQIPDTIKVFLLGSKQDIPLCQKIEKSAKSFHIVSLAGHLSFLQSAALMKDALMNYVNDSAPQHIASAVNAPVTAVFCSTVPSFGFGPLSDNSKVVETTIQLPCRPCGLHGFNKCPEGHFKCAQTISLSQLLLPQSYE